MLCLKYFFKFNEHNFFFFEKSFVTVFEAVIFDSINLNVRNVFRRDVHKRILKYKQRKMNWIREEIFLGSCYFAALNSETLLTRDKKKPAKNVCNLLGKSLRNNYAARSLWHHSETNNNNVAPIRL